MNELSINEHIIRSFHEPLLNTAPMPEVVGAERLPSWFDVAGLVTASLSIASSNLVRFTLNNADNWPKQVLDQRLANFWFGFTLKPIDWQLAPAWDSLAKSYPTQDGWIRLHTNAPHHKKAALKVLNCADSPQAAAQAVATWQGEALERAIVEAGGCAAKMNTIKQWQKHPHGQHLNDAPMVLWEHCHSIEPLERTVDRARPLKHIKILDLTRVLAGPVASRFLAGFGADVLRIDPPDWSEPGVIPEVTLGKRCAELDLTKAADRDQFELLVKDADVLLHGYRPGALEKLGFGSEALKELNPRLIDVCLNAYGWQGPMSQQRGFDSLVQMSSGIAHYGMQQSGADQPVPLPVQALDHATGYLMAAAVLQALELRSRYGKVMSAKLSLAATAALLIQTRRNTLDAETSEVTDADFHFDIEKTSWGDAQRLKFPLSIEGIPVYWALPATQLRTSPPQWKTK